MVPPEGRALQVSGVVWRVDSDGFVVLFLASLPAQHLTGTRAAAGITSTPAVEPARLEAVYWRRSRGSGSAS